MNNDGLEGDVYEIAIAHTQFVGETREHDPDPDKCWCWVEYEKRIPKKKELDNKGGI